MKGADGAIELADLPAGVAHDMERVRCLLLDVDGVLTDGRLYFDADGRETKIFHVHDASGLVYWNRAGFLSGFVSGRDSDVVRERAAELLVQEVWLGRRAKLDACRRILEKHDLDHAEVCFVGDDLLDIPLLECVGVPVSVPGGRPEVRAVSRYVTRAPAGRGAVREVVDLLLKAKGLFAEVVATCGMPKQRAEDG